MAGAVHSLADLLANQVLTTGPARESETNVALPSPWYRLDFTLVTMLLLFLALLPFHTVVGDN